MRMHTSAPTFSCMIRAVLHEQEICDGVAYVSEQPSLSRQCQQVSYCCRACMTFCLSEMSAHLCHRSGQSKVSVAECLMLRTSSLQLTSRPSGIIVFVSGLLSQCLHK